LTPIQRQQVVALAAEKKGNPLYNARQLEVEDITARLDADFAKRLILPENDPTVEAEQLRLQQMEMALLMQAQAVPVSPRDNHEIHLSVLMPAAEQTAAAVMQGAADTALLETLLGHINEHYNLAQQSGVPKEKLAPVAQLVKKAGQVLAQLKELDAQAQQMQADGQALDQEEDYQNQELAMASAALPPSAPAAPGMPA
jgi:hypothetical protein